MEQPTKEQAIESLQRVGVKDFIVIASDTSTEEVETHVRIMTEENRQVLLGVMIKLGRKLVDCRIGDEFDELMEDIKGDL